MEASPLVTVMPSAVRVWRSSGYPVARNVPTTTLFLSDHAPRLLEFETRMTRPAIPLWRIRPELLVDSEYKRDMQAALNGYFSVNWTTTRTRGIEWEALNVVLRRRKP
ncbi:hypothetical protein NDU88_003958 [Pleurodeles waltl]|uniref:SAM-dependent methyltransferase n=1 Tax=Pleurodeles waltl TaxID=8319 RepID=A0AAV7UGR5_PLEWA|nr:hypothetical protein NDU88_003958 [Pleurodeles waltl]